MSNRTRAKLFESLGFGNWENGRDIDEAHINKAGRENLILEDDFITPDPVDNHAIHIDEHTRLAVSQRCQNDEAFKERVLRHITAHKEYSTLDSGIQNLEKQMGEI
jgi:hypothetical protein